MKIENTFSFEINGAKFTFKRPTVKDLLQIDKENPLNNIILIMEKLVSVTGLEYSSGEAVGLEEVRSADLDVGTINLIMHGWNEQVAKLQGTSVESSEKKS